MYKQCIDESLKRDISNALRRYFISLNISENLEDTVQNVLDMSTETVNEIRQSSITSKGRFYESNVFSGLKDIMNDYQKELNGVHCLEIKIKIL